MTAIDTIEKHETEFRDNNFLQVARKVARKEDGEDVEFIALTRRYLDAQGSRRYKTTLTVPPEPELVEFLKDSLDEVQEGSS